MKAQVLPLIASICLLFCSCGSDEKISREVFEEVQRANEVKKVSEVDIFNEALKLGEEISVDAQNHLMVALEKVIDEKGASGAAHFCSTQIPVLLKEIGDKYGVTIRRMPYHSGNTDIETLEEERMLLEAYAYNEQNGITHEPNLQKIEDGSVLLFTKAITVTDGLCLNYKGEAGEDIDEQTLRNITPSNPEDSTESGLRGMWSIAIPQKEVVKKL